MSSKVYSPTAVGGGSYGHADCCRLGQPVRRRSDFFCGGLLKFGRVAAAGMLVTFFGIGNSPTIARADCSTSGTVATCTGDLSGGVSETGTSIETLNANSLTNDITPDNGTSGIRFRKEGADGEHPSLLAGSAGTAGSDGGAVTIGYTGDAHSISTTGNDAKGIVGWSSGGTGGGGLDGIGVGFGGHQGGSTGAVVIRSSGEINTIGDQSNGILGVTLGGSGGHGGAASSLSDATGGRGGGGETPDEVYVQSASTITTTGAGSHGILIQSLGGSGGVGGAIKIAAAGVSGDPGQSGEGGLVVLINTGDIITGGSGANGVLIQSLGGFGGDSGDVGLAIFAAAPSGSAGAAGGQVDVTNHGTVLTTGTNSDGILAQSIGGGGGHGGSSVAVVSLGGDGEGGGDGGAVSVVNHGFVSTDGVNSLGILAQSVGGGGGDGGSAAGLVAIGGSGDDAADGSTVHVINTNTVSTVADGSLGILVQSVGGGGGHGGDSYALLSIGGQSGGGGDSDVVTFENTGDVSTEGDRADAIQVQSVGGGGGKGGGALSVDPVAGASISIGGHGGSGGDGSSVFVNKDNTAISETAILTTKGDHSVGLAATSIGGGGGSGGWAVAASGGGYSVSVAVGGIKGGGGGDGGAVDTKFNGIISTQGDHSAGIASQSTGGGGGSGGTAVSIAASAVGSVDVSVGGHGAIGGYGDSVDVASWTAITTIGDHSPGIIASSIGGGGGNGGLTVGAEISAAATVGVSIGGTGTGGGYSSAVTVNSIGKITTSGDFSHGLVAQSLGGGGGNGGFAIDAAASTALTATIAIGGASAAGSNSDAVAVTSKGDIVTDGDHAYGILAQSIGGGGGNGGHAISASGALAVDASVGIGGTGDGGGDASTVTASSTGDITTYGDFGYGLIAQSLGGGGGNGGYAIGGAAALGQSASVTIGGRGAGGGDGSTVIAENIGGDVTTTGDHAHGLFAQSLGGGGGNGGYSIAGTFSTAASVPIAIGGSGEGGGNGGPVTLHNDGTVFTSGTQANAMFAQSLGGGGGDGGFSVAGGVSLSFEGAAISVAVSVGGQGGAGGTSDTVDVINEGYLHTLGQNSAGIFAQSVGGGGGNGGLSVAANIAVGDDTSLSAGVTLAGSGGTGNSASVVTVVNNESILTEGNNSAAIFAQSLGGGGGNGGASVGAGIDASGGSGGNASIAISGSGGNGNDGKKVDVTSTGNLTTKGDNSAALFAQSVGGGGGNGGFSIAGNIGNVPTVGVTVSGSGSPGGDGSVVIVDNTGIVTTSGANSFGLQAQSIGGAGGNGGFSIAGSLNTASNVNVSVSGGGGGGGTAGLVEVTQNQGSITTTGSGAHGIFAQSLGGGGGNGGFSVAGGLTLSPESSFAAGVSVAGGGGDSSTSSEVTVNNTGGIRTEGDNVAGIFAQSLGGGGNGGFSVAGNLILSAGSDAAIDVSVAGAGGTGNAGSDVKITNIGNVVTTGTNSTAILAQSIGGGGGNAGFSISGNIAASSEDGVAAGVSISGDGGDGNDGAEITLISIGSLSTSGNNSSGILAQSVGGGGGNGGFSGAFDASKQAAVGVSIGGAGELGGDADTVNVNSTGTITTDGSLSYGVLAQSVGGSGGNGGFSLSGSFSTKASVGVSIGGGAGGGGTASAVTLVQTGSVWTKGSGSHAVFAQSVGGGGGAGGFSGAAAITFKGRADVGLSVGGKGGTGGTAGSVLLISKDGTVIRTDGDGAYGLLAQSIGGGGGDGGFSFAADLGFVNSDSSTTNIAVTLGGDGGSGGAASTIDLNNAIAIVTLGDYSHGILAQSIGGGGGSGGMAISGSVNLSTDPSYNLGVAIGGSGTTGNTASKVTVENEGNVTTLGDRSRGILAQSVGGGGGAGGLAFSGTLAGGGSEATAKTIEVAVGGNGGSGANAGEVELINYGDIYTSGDLAEGILAQSVGGGGGAGGLAGTGVLSYEGGGTNLHVSVAVGGTAGVGGLGEDVEVTNNGGITVTGIGSTAIYAQSIGGGGGNGGSSFTGVIDLTKPGGGGGDSDAESNDRNLTVNVAIGGQAGSGASAGTVTVVNTGVLTTIKGSTKGIFAQSVGGSGGSGGASDAFSMELGSCSNPAIPGCGASDFTAKSLTLDVSIGGNGGDGNNGDAVSVTNKNIIRTSGDGSEAIYAQSVGAGGGEGGNGSLGQNLIDGVPGEIIGDVDTVLNPPFAFWQEIEITVGGASGATGNGGTVTVDNDNILITTGDRSSAIFAQSVGGGGGQGGNTDGNFLGVGIGGSSGAAGDGDRVEIFNDEIIWTEGIASIGIFAQSIGGGGGISGSVSQDFFGTGADVGIGVGLSKGGGHGGHGGDINVETSATIMTFGNGAHGVFAQSVGGGGGLAGSSGSDIGVNFAGSNGDDGDGGDVTVLHTGNIYVFGDGAAGIFAQSASGGADGNTGNGDDDYALDAAGISGLVTVTAKGNVMASGDNSTGIFAQSVGLNGDGQVVIVVEEDVVIIGGADPDGNGVGEDPAGIRILDGSGNSLTINGTVMTVDGVLGTAIDVRETQANPATAIEDLSGGASINFLAVEHTGTTIINNGTVIGSIFLADADNHFINTDTFIAGETIDLGGTDNQFVNDGILSPGGADHIITTTLNGAFLQTENGQILTDVDFADNDAGVNTSDVITITGDAVVNGTIVINSLNGAFVEPNETGEVAIITSAGEFGTPSFVVRDTEVVDYELRTDADGNVFLAWNVDFSQSASNFNTNQSAIGDYLVATIAAGEPEELTPLINEVLDAPNAAVLAGYYDQLSPEPYLQTEQAAVLSAQKFGRGLYECTEDAVPVSGKGCGWVSVSGRKSTQSSEFEKTGYDESVLEMQFGIGGSLGKQMGILFGISYEKTYLKTEDLASSEGYRLQSGVGVSIANDSGTVLSIAAVGGYASSDVERYQTLTGAAVTARGNQKLYYGGGQARVQQTFLFDDISVAPEIGAWVGYFRHNKLTETGAGPTNLQINAGSNTYAALRPAVTVGTEFLSNDGSFFRPYMGGGVSFALTEGGLSRTNLTANLQGDSNLAPAFTASRSMENPYYDVQLGLDWVSPAGVAFRVGGIAQFANNYRSYGGTMRLVAPF